MVLELSSCQFMWHDTFVVPNGRSLPAPMPLCSPLSLILGLAMWHVDIWDMSKHDTNGGLLISIKIILLQGFLFESRCCVMKPPKQLCGEPTWRREAPSRVLSGASPSGVSKSQPTTSLWITREGRVFHIFRHKTTRTKKIWQRLLWPIK